jgi:hypothetical protein
MIEDVEVITENDNILKIKATSDVCKKRGHASLKGIVTDIKIRGQSWHRNTGKASQMCKQTKNEYWLYRETICGGCSFGGAIQMLQYSVS